MMFCFRAPPIHHIILEVDYYSPRNRRENVTVKNQMQVQTRISGIVGVEIGWHTRHFCLDAFRWQVFRNFYWGAGGGGGISHFMAILVLQMRTKQVNFQLNFHSGHWRAYEFLGTLAAWLAAAELNEAWCAPSSGLVGKQTPRKAKGKLPSPLKGKDGSKGGIKLFCPKYHFNKNPPLNKKARTKREAVPRRCYGESPACAAALLA